MTPLSLDDQRFLDAAEGWIGLGDYASANEELEQISPEMRAHPEVLLARWKIYARALKWETCIDIANAVIEVAPDIAAGWLQRSFALHELKRTQEAYDLLLPVAGKFPENW